MEVAYFQISRLTYFTKAISTASSDLFILPITHDTAHPLTNAPSDRSLWPEKSVWMFRKREKFPAPSRNRTNTPRSYNPHSLYRLCYSGSTVIRYPVISSSMNTSLQETMTTKRWMKNPVCSVSIRDETLRNYTHLQLIHPHVQTHLLLSQKLY